VQRGGELSGADDYRDMRDSYMRTQFGIDIPEGDDYGDLHDWSRPELQLHGDG
jgi:hypothetical protein